MSEIKCNMCNDTGICSSCKGEGTIQGERRCEMCDGTGICLCQHEDQISPQPRVASSLETSSSIKEPEFTPIIPNDISASTRSEGGREAITRVQETSITTRESISGATEPRQPITLERLRENIDAIPTQREPIASEEYLTFVKNNLKAANFGVQFDFNAFPQLIASTVMSIGWYPLPVLLAVGYIKNIDRALIQNLNREMRDIARNIRKERNNLVIVALCSENISPDIIKWIERVEIPKVHDYHSLPVIFELTTQEIHYNRDRGIWGSQVYSRMKYIIGKYLDKSPQARDLKQPKGLEIFICIICTIMLFCLVMMIIL